MAGLLHGETGAERVYDVERATIELPDDLKLAQPIDGRVRLTRTNRGILAEADSGPRSTWSASAA